ncbi:MAG: hypothetical protein JXA11_07120 [Phycisphaerae bacterium]|nr:hypothetical protein [Phycisphaerae bacterium]
MSKAKSYHAKLESVRDLTHDIKLLRFALIEPKRIEFIPGQYISLHLPESVDPSGSSRTFSFAGPPSDEGHVELLIKRHPGGLGTGWIFDILQVGQTVDFDAPYGRFGLSDSGAEMIWIAGGSGMSAFRSILRDMVERNIARPTTLYFGAVAMRDLYLQEELRRYERERDWFTYIPALSKPDPDDAWSGEVGLVTEVVDRRLTDGANVEAYLCGPAGMIDAGREMLRAKGVGDERIFFDKFAHR